MKTALVLGGTGLTGMYVLKNLIENDAYDKIIILTRRAVSPKSDKIITIQTDFKDLTVLDNFEKIDSIFSCLGTTRKQTPDLVQYRKIEIGIPYKVVQYCINNNKGVQNVHYISAIGANVDAKNFYLGIKGEAEMCLQLLEIPHLFIYRPSLILGDRKDNRVLENFAKLIMPTFNIMMIGKMAKYKSIPAKDIAKAMVINDSRVEMPQLSFYFVDTIQNILVNQPH